MDWLKIMMTSHNLAWNGRAFGYVIAGKRLVAFVMSVVSFLKKVFVQFKTFYSHTWWGRNFDFNGFFYISIPALTLFFVTLPSDKTVYDIIEKHTLLIGALLGFPILIKRVAEMQEQTRISREQLHFSQFADAYGKLWSLDLGTRMTAIESLWRFAQAYPKEEYKKVMDVFSQFIRHPQPYELDEKRQKKHRHLKSVRPQYFKQEKTPAGKRTDIGAILQDMGEERMEGAKNYKIDLRHVHLEEAHLWHAHLERADLSGAHLEGAHFWDAHLERARLVGAHLEGADLSDAHLEGAHLIATNLGEADLSDAHLEGAYLWHAHLEGADLEGAYLEGALLWNTNLKDAILKLAVINSADFSDAKNLTKEQIDSCVFITDHTKFKKKPQLPKGFKRTYRKLTFKKWQKEKDELPF